MMRISPARVLLVALALALAGLSAWSLRYFKRYQPLAGLMPGPSALDQVGLQVTDAVVTGRVGGRRRWRVAARRITFSRDQRQVSVDGIRHGTLFDDRERPLAALTAGGAVYQSPLPVFGAGTEGYLQVSGGLRARLLRPNGPTVATASLAWDPARSLVSSLGPVTARFPPHAGAVSGVQIAADGVQWEARTDLMHSPGHVQVVFAQGAGEARGEDVAVDIRTGNLTLHHLHGTFRLTQGVQQSMATQSSRPIAALAGVVLAAVSPPAAPAAPQSRHDVIYDAGASSWLSAPHVVQMSQGVKFNQDDAWLETDAAIVNLDDEQHALNAESRAPVHLWDSQNDLTGQHGYIDFTKHLATVQDKITLVVKPGPRNTNAPKGSLRGRFKDPATMTCEKMIYDYRRKFGQVPGPLTIRQKDRVLTADSGTYDGRVQIVILNGHVRGHDRDNVVSASHVIVGIREGDEFIKVDVPMHGAFRVKPDDSDNSDDTAPPDDPNAYDAIKNG
ncbi:MAG: hypothetical protein JO250_08665, partial [Armatimonadetes bacterium]|nr:hypothetical protein [Armatimonadota bacterium]